jgi:hypothetical protein
MNDYRMSSVRSRLYAVVHHTAPPQIEEFFFNLIAAGFVLILTMRSGCSGFSRATKPSKI